MKATLGFSRLIALLVDAGLTRDQLLDQKESFKRHSFNVSASDGELMDRFIPDTRPQQ